MLSNNQGSKTNDKNPLSQPIKLPLSGNKVHWVNQHPRKRYVTLYEADLKRLVEMEIATNSTNSDLSKHLMHAQQQMNPKVVSYLN
jgi:hypothetical protein